MKLPRISLRFLFASLSLVCLAIGYVVMNAKQAARMTQQREHLNAIEQRVNVLESKMQSHDHDDSNYRLFPVGVERGMMYDGFKPIKIRRKMTELFESTTPMKPIPNR